MKRRDFILASGSTVLSGLATSQIQRPAIGLDFEISTPDKDPSEVDSLVIEFETLEITLKYLDENETVNVQAKVDVEGKTKKSNEVQASVVNGETKNLENSIDSIVVDGLNTSSSISGDVTVSIDHPDIQDSYSQRFYLNGSEIPNSGLLYYKGEGEEYWEQNILNGNRTEFNKQDNYLELIVGDTNSSVTGKARFEDTIDASQYDTAEIEWARVDDGDEDSRVRFAVNDTDMNILKEITILENAFSKKIDTFDISDIDEDIYVSFSGREWRGRYSVGIQLETYRVELY